MSNCGSKTSEVIDRRGWLAVVLTLVAYIVGCGQPKPTPAPVSTSPIATPGTPSDPAAPVSGSPRIVTIAAASDLRFALEEVLAEFSKAHPDIQTKATFGSSGNFFAQLSNKAPFDLYLSADVEYPRKLIEQDLAIRESEFSYAIGHVVVWVRTESPLKLDETGLETLLDPSIQKIAIANPKHAPYGRAALAALKSLGVHDRVEAKLVLAENIGQTAQFIETGAADIGMISQSLALAPHLKEKGRFWLVPESAHPPIEQGGVILNWAKDRAAAEEVRSFLISDAGRAILKTYGFDEPTSKSP